MTRRRCLVIAFVLAAITAAIAATPALAVTLKRDHQTAFPTTSPAGLAVDQKNGDVYALDNTNGVVRRYTASGAPEDFTAGPDATTNTLGGSSPFTIFGVVGGVAVDRSGGPSDGNIYVLDFGPSFTGELHVYSNAGAPLGVIDGTSTVGGANGDGAFSSACGFGVDQSTGDVYIADGNDGTNGIVWRYTPSGATLSESDYSGAIKAAGPICGVAAAQGHVYTADTFSFGEVRAYADSGFTNPAPNPSPASTLIDTGVNAVAADPNGDVYVDKGPSISVFDPTGASLYSFGTGDFGSSTPSIGVAVRGPGGNAYVADQDASEIHVYGPFASGNLPATAATAAASQLGHTTATLGGHVDPADDEVTACHFDYLTAADYAANGSSYTGAHSPTTVPCAEGQSFASPADVTAPLTGLHPGTTYHFRLRITGTATGEVDGGDQTLTTTDFPVTTEPATNLHHTDVVLNGTFDPQGDPNLDVTACSFDWVSDTQFQIDQFASAASLPCAEGQSFASAHSVSALINNLSPGTVYHFRLHLDTAGAGQNFSQDRTVTPPLFPTVAPQIAAFGPDGTSGSTFSPTRLGSLAFDQASQRLYAAYRNTNEGDPGQIYGFDASHPDSGSFPVVSGFNPLTTAPLGLNALIALAVDNSGQPSAGHLFLADADLAGGSGGTANGKLFGFDSTGSALGGNFPLDPGVSPGPPAGSSHEICGTAVDFSGDVWVANGAATDQLHRYDSSGAFQSSLDVSPQFPSPFFGPCRLAFDSHDNLYVGEFLGAVWRFNSPSYTTATQIEPSSAHLVDLAVDPTTDDLYVAHDSDVKRYDSSGALQSTFATGISDSSFGSVAVDSSTHDVYVADNGSVAQNVPARIRVFHPSTQHPPTLTPGDPTAITGSSATLNAKVDPETFQVTDCHFDWGTDASYGNTAPCVPDPGSGSGDVSVHADISGLNGGSTYHFRIVAQNAEPGGTATGADQTLTTLGPAISETKATGISDSAATLRAQVDPQGHSTTYQFQYGTDPSYGHTAPAPAAAAAIGSGTSALAVAEHIAGLDPATTYHFRVNAISSDGTDHGPDASFTTFTSSPGGPDTCPNAALRTGPSAALPDCRAYEQASPAAKNGVGIAGAPNFNQAAADGHAAVFTAFGDLPSSGGHSAASITYVADRGPSGWSYDSVQPAASVQGQAIELARDDGLRVSLSKFDDVSSGGGLVATDLTGPAGFTRQQIVSTGVGNGNALEPDPAFASDPQHLIFESSAVLAPDAVSGKQNLYDYDHGQLTLAGRVPAFPATSCTDGGSPAEDCTGPTGGSFAGAFNLENNVTSGPDLSHGNGYKQNTISADGTKVFFTEGATGRLYERQNGTSTIQISAPQGTTDPAGHKPAGFQGATPDGHTVYFTSCERLTPDSTVLSTAANTCFTFAQGQDLYAYDTQNDQLTDLTVDPNGSDPQRAGVQGLLGASPDGSYVYFAANGDLDGSGPATAGNCDSSQGFGHFQGSCSVYLAHAGQISFVARLGDPQINKDDANWQPARDLITAGAGKTSRVAAGGALLFSSDRSLTGYDNTDPTGACGGFDTNPPFPPFTAPCTELYRFDPSANGGDGQLDCVSCDPSGAAPTGPPTLQSSQAHGKANLENPDLNLLTRNLSATGDRVFFETPDKLLPADTNSDGCQPFLSAPPAGNVIGFPCQDVYEWEASGSGSCHSSAEDGGCLYLLSSGTSTDPAYLDDASASGDDVFIYTPDPLVPQDRDQLTDLYDVRVGGGFGSQHQSSAPPCSGDACQGTPSAQPAVPPAASVTFSGPGNSSRGNATSKLTAAKVKVLTRTVRVSGFLLTVKVPGKGRVTVSGVGIRTLRRSVSKAGTYRLRVTLTAKEKRLLRHKRRLKLKLRVSYAPVSGSSSSVTFSITDKA